MDQPKEEGQEELPIPWRYERDPRRREYLHSVFRLLKQSGIIYHPETESVEFERDNREEFNVRRKDLNFGTERAHRPLPLPIGYGVANRTPPMDPPPPGSLNFEEDCKVMSQFLRPAPRMNHRSVSMPNGSSNENWKVNGNDFTANWNPFFGYESFNENHQSMNNNRFEELEFMHGRDDSYASQWSDEGGPGQHGMTHFWNANELRSNHAEARRFMLNQVQAFATGQLEIPGLLHPLMNSPEAYRLLERPESYQTQMMGRESDESYEEALQKLERMGSRLPGYINYKKPEQVQQQQPWSSDNEDSKNPWGVFQPAGPPENFQIPRRRLPTFPFQGFPPLPVMNNRQFQQRVPMPARTSVVMTPPHPNFQFPVPGQRIENGALPRILNSANAPGNGNGIQSLIGNRIDMDDAGIQQLIRQQDIGFQRFAGQGSGLAALAGQASIRTQESYDLTPRDGSPPHTPNSNENNRRRANLCGFCRNNGEPEEVYMSHLLHNPDTGEVTCPTLFRYKCRICDATGPDAHTESHCAYVSRRPQKVLELNLAEHLGLTSNSQE